MNTSQLRIKLLFWYILMDTDPIKRSKMFKIIKFDAIESIEDILGQDQMEDINILVEHIMDKYEDAWI